MRKNDAGIVYPESGRVTKNIECDTLTTSGHNSCTGDTFPVNEQLLPVRHFRSSICLFPY